MLSASFRVLIAALVFGGVSLPSAMAQVEPESDQPGQPRMSREQWLADVEAARLRVEERRRQGRSFAAPVPSDEEVGRETFQRILEDDSLRAGDIVATSRGLLMFKGQSSDERSLSDFAPVAPGAKKP
jgi:hypothetical protein